MPERAGRKLGWREDRDEVIELSSRFEMSFDPTSLPQSLLAITDRVYVHAISGMLRDPNGFVQMLSHLYIKTNIDQRSTTLDLDESLLIVMQQNGIFLAEDSVF